MSSIINAATSGGLISTGDTSGILKLQTAGTDAVTITAAQNVGIGTASPSSKLHVVGDVRIGSAGRALFFNAGNTSYGYILAPTTDSSLAFYTNSEAMRIDSSGNLGVGTTSPNGYRLNVQQSAADNLGINITASNGTSIVRMLHNGTIAAINVSYIGGGSYTPLTFWTSDSERARIDTSGNFLVGQASAGLQNSTSFAAGPSAAGFVANHASGVGGGTTYAVFGYNATQIGSITQNGTTGVLYNLTSDYRLKNDQQPLTGAKDFVMALQPKKWQWWDGSGEGVGFIAHEFMEVAKYSGQGEKDAVDTDGKPLYQSIQPSSSEVMANLVSFIQEQQALITSLTERITALEGAQAQ